jgi:hypothetical protein
MMAATLLLAACGGGSTPPEDGPAPNVGGGSVTVVTPRVGGSAPNVTSLIGAREALALTSVQINTLDSIRGAWAEVDMRLRAEMREGNGAAGPAVMRMAENNAAAHDAIEQVLTPEQRRTVCGMPGARPVPQPVAGPPAGRRGDMARRRARGLPGDSIPAMQMGGGWPWCGRPIPG